MKICLINNLYKPYARGGAERVVELSAEGFVREGHEVVIITTRPYFSGKELEIRNDKIKLHYLPSLYYNLNKISFYLRLFWHALDMFNIINFVKVLVIFKKEKIDLVITHNLKGISYLIPLAAKFLKIKHAHTLHDIQLIHPSGLMFYGKEEDLSSVSAKIYSRICSFLFGSPHAVISPSNWLLKMHEDRGFFKDSKKIVLNNPVSGIEAPSPLEIRRGEKGTEFRFLYVGQIEEHKGVFMLIDAFNQLEESHKEIRLAVAGGGTKLDMLRERKKEKRSIEFLGKRNKDEVRTLMINSDCLVVPSLCYENSPNVISEAMLSGLYVIASNFGGIPEIFDNDEDFLFTPETKKLRIKMHEILENRENLSNIKSKLKKRTANLSSYNYSRTLLENIYC